ncbi:MAG: type I-C CRISPR-associated protein Cas8c/Csd1 [Planctomycetota bacterium]|nr:type I-C CRISPR-associated protein Cas8c/Csd1 [Planctomycetota bacterium]
MILQSLVKLAEREGLVDDPNFEMREVHWVVHLKPDGRLINLQSLLRPPEGKKGKPRGLKLPIPRQSGRTSGDKAEFLVDKAEYVFGVGDRDAGKLAARHGLFVDEIERAAKETGSSSLAAIQRFLASKPHLAAAVKEVTARVTAKELESNHLFVFQVEGDSDYVHRLDSVATYWAGVRGKQQQGAELHQCLVSGEQAVLADKHPPIKRVPGGSTSGVAIVSFNASAFESYGFERNSNAPVSRAAAEAYTTALNRLLDPSWPDPKEPTITLPRQMMRLSEDTAAVFWADNDSRVPSAIAPAVEEANLSALEALHIRLDPSLFQMNDAADSNSATPVGDALHAPWEGGKPLDLDDSAAFRLLILSGGQGRATVRAFHTDTTQRVVRAIQGWFEDISIVGLRGKPALWRLLRSLAVRGDQSMLPPNLAGEVFVCVLANRPLPLSVLEAAVRRCRSEPQRRVTPERAALIKAVLRCNRQRFTKEFNVHFEEVLPAMNENEKNKGYLLGRLFACVERMQELALGDVGASVTDRYFAAACATPQAVFPRLLKSEVHYFRKARDGRFGGAAVFTHRMIDKLSNWLVGQQNGMQEKESVEDFVKRNAGKRLVGFPAFLPLPEQGLFTLGYHQQRAEFFTKREKEPVAEGA